MLYNLGYETGLELNTLVRSNPFVLTSDGLVSLSVNRGTLIVNDINQGPTANAIAGSIIEIEVTSGNQYATPTFVQLRQGDELEGIFAAINRVDEVFVYNDVLNGKYAFEVLSDSTWTPLDDGKIGLLSDDLSYVDITPKSIDKVILGNLRNKLHVLDYYLNHVNVFKLDGEYLGRVAHSYLAPIDTTTVYDLDTQGRIVTAIAFESSDKVVLYSNTYDPLHEIDIVKPVGLASNKNLLYVAQRDSLDISVFAVSKFGIPGIPFVINLTRQPHRLYTVGEFLAVLTETSVEFIDETNSVVDTLLLPPFASSLSYDLEGQRLFISHRQERKVTIVNLDFVNGHTQESRFFINQGYLDAIVYNRFTDTFYVSDVVTRQIVEYDTSFNQVNITELVDRHSYEMYLSASGNNLIFSSIYPTIDERLIIGDGDPDAQEYFDVSNIQINQTVETISYTLQGVRDPITLFLYPDDTDINIEIKTEEGTYTQGTVINLGNEFKFVVGLPNNRPRIVQFVLGQSVYEFYASPDTRRLIPDALVFDPVEKALPLVTYASNLNTVKVLDEPCVITTDGNSTIYVNGVLKEYEATVVEGDTFYLSMESPELDSQHLITEIDYGGLFQTSWVITNQDPIDLNIGSTTDFVDVFNADLGKEITSLPIHIQMDQASTVIVTDNYSVELVVNDVSVGNTATLEDGDKLQLKLTTEFFYGTEHQITLTLSNYSLTWSVFTLPAYPIIPLEFGFNEGVTLGDRVDSEGVKLKTIDAGEEIRITIPRNVYPYVNGVPYLLPTALRDINYRGVLRRPVVITVRGQDTIELKGFALGPYGSVTQHKVQAGNSIGYWLIRSIDATDAVPSREIVFTGSHEPFVQTSFLPQVVREEALIAFTSLPTPVSHTETLHSSGHTELENRGLSLVSLDSNSYTLEGMDQIYAKYNRPLLLLTDPTYIKSSGGIVHIDPDRTFEKSSSGLLTIDESSLFEKKLSTSYHIDKPNFIKQIPGLEVTEENRFYEIHGYRIVPIQERTFVRTLPVATISATIIYEKVLPIVTVDMDSTYEKGKGPQVNNLEIEYNKGLAPKINNVEILYNKGSSPLVNEVTIFYSKPTPIKTVDIDLYYEKTSVIKIIDHESTYTKDTPKTFLTTPIYLGVEVEFSLLHGSKIVREETVKAIVADLPSTIFEIVPRTVADPSMYTHRIPVEDPRVGVFGGHYTHQVIDQKPIVYTGINTFSISVFGRPSITINAEDCSTLGNEDCLQSGYFASEEAARLDATNNWMVHAASIKTSEVSPGCWIWSQILPCFNSCYGCPSTGYIQGG
jgi:hypothetical protein